VATWDPHTHPIITEVAGSILFRGHGRGYHVNRQTDELTGLSSIVVMDASRSAQRRQGLRPAVKLLDAKGKEASLPGTDIPAHYFLPPGALVSLADGAAVTVGDVIARIPQESVEDPRHHRRSAARGRPVRGAQAEGAGDPRRGLGHRHFGKETKGKRRLIIDRRPDPGRRQQDHYES
jgi:DNA-directed RNA polymerase subunit beta'